MRDLLRPPPPASSSPKEQRTPGAEHGVLGQVTSPLLWFAGSVQQRTAVLCVYQALTRLSPGVFMFHYRFTTRREHRHRPSPSPPRPPRPPRADTCLRALVFEEEQKRPRPAR